MYWQLKPLLCCFWFNLIPGCRVKILQLQLQGQNNRASRGETVKGQTVSCCRTRSVKNLQRFSLLSRSPAARTSALSPEVMPSTSSSLKRSGITPGRKGTITLSDWNWFPKALSNDVPDYDQHRYKGIWFQPVANKSFIMTRKRSSGICASVSSRATRWFFTPVFRNSPARSVWVKPNQPLNDAYCSNGPHAYGQLSFIFNLLSITAARLHVPWWCTLIFFPKEIIQ